MKMVRTSIDRTSLSEALLDTAKVHLRVEFTRDDAYITQAITRAIDFFERATGMMIFPAEYDWVPLAGYALDGQQYYALPFQPAPTFTVSDADGVDISNQFEIRALGSPDVFAERVFVSLNGAMDPALVVKVKAGYADEDSLPPGVLNFVLQATSWFYENRDAGPMPGGDGVPYLNQLLTSYWVPRV